MKAEEITKGSVLLATLNEDNYPFGMHKDLIDDLHRMINVALTIPVVSQRSGQLPAFLERKGDSVITIKTAGTDVSLDWREFLKADNCG